MEPVTPGAPGNLEITGIGELNEMDLTNVNTKRTVLKAGPMALRIDKIEIKPGKPKDGEMPFNNVEVYLSTVGVEKDKDNAEVPPGHKLIEVLTLKKTDKFDPRENLARLQECFLGEKKKWNTEEFIGKEGAVRMGISPAEGQYEERNRVMGWIKKKTGGASGAPTIG